ncbi:ribbon-helix-helix domain-containing protein [Halobaculum sp. CBA1158]|uniref:ribbon-helix-helix domain-containing protein n=1 Tax=Halobaculum sp. CBA1158 TaxID=2904243 RepID=UPI001F374B95|nr:ribbon-helix-helix domain-containing protein [Halobaculum sp. CBA1158]UIP00352.1 ribbon-helix-helix domain-containing protein [Halobaculum sp. CBA1158]
MSTDTNAGDDRLEEISVRVPESPPRRIEEEWDRRGYSSESEAVRDALRDRVHPPATPSEGTLADPEESRERADRGETVSARAPRERPGLDD